MGNGVGDVPTRGRRWLLPVGLVKVGHDVVECAMFASKVVADLVHIRNVPGGRWSKRNDELRSGVEGLRQLVN